MNIKFENKVYDLSSKENKTLLCGAIETHFKEVVFKTKDCSFIDLEELHELYELVFNQDFKGLLNNSLIEGKFIFQKANN